MIYIIRLKYCDIVEHWAWAWALGSMAPAPTRGKARMLLSMWRVKREKNISALGACIKYISTWRQHKPNDLLTNWLDWLAKVRSYVYAIRDTRMPNKMYLYIFDSDGAHIFRLSNIFTKATRDYRSWYMNIIQILSRFFLCRYVCSALCSVLVYSYARGWVVSTNYECTQYLWRVLLI